MAHILKIIFLPPNRHIPKGSCACHRKNVETLLIKSFQMGQIIVWESNINTRKHNPRSAAQGTTAGLRDESQVSRSVAAERKKKNKIWKYQGRVSASWSEEKRETDGRKEETEGGREGLVKWQTCSGEEWRRPRGFLKWWRSEKSFWRGRGVGRLTSSWLRKNKQRK